MVISLTQPCLQLSPVASTQPRFLARKIGTLRVVLQTPPARGLPSVTLDLALLACFARHGERALSFRGPGLAAVRFVGARVLDAAPVLVLVLVLVADSRRV